MQILLWLISLQTVPHDGVGSESLAEGSKGILGFSARWVRRARRARGRSNARTAMTASQMRIAETIDAFYGDAGTKDGVSRSYKQAVEDLDAETIKALDGPYRQVWE